MRKLVVGTIGAILGAVLGAIAWAALTAATHFQIGYMALGVGLLAGAGMRYFGGGGTRADAVVAGVVALLGCLLGNLMAADIVVAQHEHYPIADMILVSLMMPAVAVDLIRSGFDLMDLFFYALAVYAGYRAALKPRASPAPQGMPLTAGTPPEPRP